MKYSKQEIMQYILEDDVKFIRLAFCDVYGKMKNISIMPSELERAFEYGIAIDASAIPGFGDETSHCDLLLHPDPDTLSVLPWRPEHGKVVRMYCSITYPDGTPFECDTRSLLIGAVREAKESGYTFSFAAEQEFYLFRLDENGEPTDIPCDNAGYMDIAPEDSGENIRREICLTLEQMEIRPESSHHEEGPGQNEIDFRYSDPVTAADNAMTFRNVVKTVAARNGLHADFRPKPIPNRPGSSFHVHISLETADGEDHMSCMIAGILDKVAEMTAFLNPTDNSYERLVSPAAPKYISWSEGNRAQILRVSRASGHNKKAELRSPDPSVNPYIAFALIIRACMYGIEYALPLPEAAGTDPHAAPPAPETMLKRIPRSLKEARAAASNSLFIREHLPRKILELYCTDGSGGNE